MIFCCSFIRSLFLLCTSTDTRRPFLPPLPDDWGREKANRGVRWKRLAEVKLDGGIYRSLMRGRGTLVSQWGLGASIARGTQRTNVLVIVWRPQAGENGLILLVQWMPWLQ